MNFKSIFSYLGLVLEILGILLLIPIIVSWVMGENVYVPFFIAAIISFVFGTLMDKKFKKEELTLGSAMVLSSITFVIISLIGAIPFLFYMDPVNSIFESVSGFTTTGMTVVNPESLPNTILFWRSFTQWVGGIGILVIFLLLVASPGISSYYVYESEARTDRIEASVRSTVKRIFIIYGAFTIIGILLLIIFGMSAFDSVNHTFTALSTGGFSTKNQSIGAYNSVAIEIVIIILMVLGATSFFIHDKLLKKKFRDYIKDPETRLFWILIITFSILVSISFISLAEPVRHGIFQTFSALTTTGFTTLSLDPSNLSKLLLIILMVIGGYAGSTAGGLKLIRVSVLIKSFSWLGKKISLPNSAVFPLKFKERTIKDSELIIISLFVLIYIVILVVSTLILVGLGYPPMNSLFNASSAQGTVGLSFGPLDSMHWIGKIVLMFNMLVGRLEILPFLVLFYILWKSKPERSRL
jgi:trk system potassium uptake protein TrkH